jgi:hypothetical protein
MNYEKECVQNTLEKVMRPWEFVPPIKKHLAIGMPILKTGPLVLLCLLPFTNTEKSISFHFSMERFKRYHYQVETPFLVYSTNS